MELPKQINPKTIDEIEKEIGVCVETLEKFYEKVKIGKLDNGDFIFIDVDGVRYFNSKLFYGIFYLQNRIVYLNTLAIMKKFEQGELLDGIFIINSLMDMVKGISDDSLRSYKRK